MSSQVNCSIGTMTSIRKYLKVGRQNVTKGSQLIRLSTLTVPKKLPKRGQNGQGSARRDKGSSREFILIQDLKVLLQDRARVALSPMTRALVQWTSLARVSVPTRMASTFTFAETFQPNVLPQAEDPGTHRRMRRKMSLIPVGLVDNNKPRVPHHVYPILSKSPSSAKSDFDMAWDHDNQKESVNSKNPGVDSEGISG